MSERLSLVGDPSLASDPAYCGHLCNDGACLGLGPSSNSSDPADISDVDVAQYSRLSASRANAAQLPLQGGAHFATVATRAIAAGEEVLISYGAGYWLSRSAHPDQARVAAAAAGLNPNNQKARRAPKVGMQQGGAGTTTAKKSGFGK